MAETKTCASPEDMKPEEEENVFKDQGEFLKAIYPNFLRHIYPFKDGLMDELMQRGVFNSDDEDEIKHKKTRKRRARKCWVLFNKVPPRCFQEHCLPALKTLCPLAVQQKTFQWDGKEEGCLRHAIQSRVQVVQLADILVPVGGCTPAELGLMTEGEVADCTLWDKVFQLCSKKHDNEDFMRHLKTILSNIQVSVPDNLPSLLADGLQCICHRTTTSPHGEGKRKISMKKPLKRLTSRSDNKQFSMTGEKRQPFINKKFPMPKGRLLSTVRKDPRPVETTTAADSQNNDAHDQLGEDGSFAAEEDQECCFESEEQKEMCLMLLETLNADIITVCSIKNLFHQLTGQETELRTFMGKTQVHCTKGTIQEDMKIREYINNINNIKDKLQNYCKQRSRIWNNAIKIRSDSSLPLKYNGTILNRNEVLIEEYEEAEKFYTQCEDILYRLNMEYGGQLAPEIVMDATPWSLHEVPAQSAEEMDEYDDTFYEREPDSEYQKDRNQFHEEQSEAGDDGELADAEHGRFDGSMLQAVAQLHSLENPFRLAHKRQMMA